MKKSNNYLFAAFFFIILGIFTIVAIVLHFVFAGHKYQEYGTLGDAIGGLTNPIIAIGAAILTFVAFYIQYQANKQIQDQFKVQQFESQFYEMIRLHRANIDEMDIASRVKGRKCFVRMFQEYKFIYLKLYEIYNKNKTFKSKLDKRDLCEITYFVFFFGIGLNTEDLIIKLIKPKQELITKKLFDILKPIKDEWKNRKKPEKTEKEENKKNKEIKNYLRRSISNENGVNFEYKITYTPFDGHNTRLGHYYRHLYQTVSFIVNSKTIKKREKKYKYLKLLRAQLSNHEQLLLYYNSLTSFGKGWIYNKYFTNYKMIKNIPIDFADFGILPSELLGNKNDFDELIFEWDEL